MVGEGGYCLITAFARDDLYKRIPGDSVRKYLEGFAELVLAGIFRGEVLGVVSYLFRGGEPS